MGPRTSFGCNMQIWKAFSSSLGRRRYPHPLFVLALTTTTTNCRSAILACSALASSVSSGSSRSSYRFHTTTSTRSHSTSLSNMSSDERIIEWKDRSDQAIQTCILPLSSSSHKGSSGRIGILGGSERYTGAPYYASMASLRVGADLAFCFCAQEAALPIKSYSPELMVLPVYSAAAVHSEDLSPQEAE